MSYLTNHAKSFVGQHANIHLKDGGVIVNVKISNVSAKRKDITFAVEHKHESLRLSKVEYLTGVTTW